MNRSATPIVCASQAARGRLADFVPGLAGEEGDYRPSIYKSPPSV